MGYFPTSDDGDAYAARWCARCAHRGRGVGARECCPVWWLHLLYNREQERRPTTAEALSIFIPRLATGGNGRCVMFAKARQAAPAPEGQRALGFEGQSEAARRQLRLEGDL